jgi:hypothetical protein
LNQRGEQVRSEALLAKGPLVVSFYRGVRLHYVRNSSGNSPAAWGHRTISILVSAYNERGTRWQCGTSDAL